VGEVPGAKRRICGKLRIFTLLEREYHLGAKIFGRPRHEHRTGRRNREKRKRRRKYHKKRKGHIQLNEGGKTKEEIGRDLPLRGEKRTWSRGGRKLQKAKDRHFVPKPD